MDRRTFMHSVAGAVATAGLAQAGCARTSASEELASAAPVLAAMPIGIQLYTVRRLMAEAPERTLASLAEIGYREVELAGLYKLTAKDFRAMLDRTGLKAPAGHIGLDLLRNKRDKTLDDAAVLGHEWIVVPWIDNAERTVEGLTALAGTFNQIATAAQKRDLRFGYHNHGFEDTPIGGVVPFDLLLERTDPQLVYFEIDLFWLRKGGGDPLHYFKRFPGRFPMVHVKDMTADGKMVNVGEGVMNFAGVIAHAGEAGIEHYFIEHDEPSQPLQDARVSFEAMKKLLAGH